MKKILIIFIIVISFGIFFSISKKYIYSYGKDFNNDVLKEYKDIKHHDLKTIKAYKKGLYESNGKYIQLKGINYGNWLIQEGWMTPNSLGAKYNNDGTFLKVNEEGIVEEYEPVFNEDLENALNNNPNLTLEQVNNLWDIWYKSYCTEDDFKKIKDLGFNMIRLPMYYKNFMEGDDLNLTMKEEPFKLIDWFLEMAKKYELYVILDLHGVVGGQSGYEHSGTSKHEFWDNKVYQDEMIYLWENIVKHYKYERNDLAETIAAYDLINEPTLDGSVTKKKQWKVMDKIYKAIRKIDIDHVISIEGCWRFTNLPNPKKYGWENVLYQYHIYNWDYNTNKNENYFFDHWLKFVLADYECPKYIGEFNFFNQKEEWLKYLNEFDLRGFSWSIWSYKTISVGWWDSSWGVYIDKMNLKNEKLKLDVRTATYDEIYDVWSNQETTKRYNNTGILKEVLDEYFYNINK